MDRKSASFLALGLVVGGLLAAAVFVGVIRRDKAASASGDGAGARTVLKFAHSLDQAHPVHAAIMHFAERVGAISGGEIQVQVFPNGQLGSEPECIEQLQRGALALVKTSAAAMEGFVPDMAVFSFPYLFRDETHFWNVANGAIGRELLAAGADKGIHGLCYYDAGARSFYTTGRPVLVPADLKELKIRVQASKMARDLVLTLGGGPTPIPWGELYTALQQKMVDGAENNPPSFLSSRHYEVARHYSLDEHTRVPDIVILSQKIWDGLPARSRAWLDQAAAESVVFQRKLWAEKTAEALATVEKAGVTIHRPDQAAFAAATAPMLQDYAGTRLGELAERIRTTK